MNNKNYRTLLILALIFLTYFCQGQNIQNRRSKILSSAKAKFDSLYPRARGIFWHQTRDSETVQFGCNCEETVGMIILTFDTNGNVLNKEVHFDNIKNLPDTIINYMKKKSSKSVKFASDFMIKYISNKGEISYGIFMSETGGNGYNSYEEYILKFKPTGEFITKEKQELEAR
jgi:hypothetical protein